GDGKTDEAVAALRTILSTDAWKAAPYFNLGQIQERGGRIDDAIASHRRVVDAAAMLVLDDTVQRARLALGRLLAGKGDTAGAKVQFDILGKQWAHADPDFIQAQELRKLIK